MLDVYLRAVRFFSNDSGKTIAMANDNRMIFSLHIVPVRPLINSTKGFSLKKEIYYRYLHNNNYLRTSTEVSKYLT